ncbi:N-formylglutamate amidohydrolase [Pelagerythrobacter rhizovicinus]|uniref:N-formylglutamate amidohydrolase n=1 Tax=Pelagerythrobacter rhizovicinus TaxID=2268576 RepID=A0A4Q2KNQ0_9SPHN|nr:N-formylglutamate amidohydrolase [Pelagerythrobacter rhizovicinus]RXZ65960.1 N-formylglutamate amidohydrolase [Pelagerythrobacter rhizovicinus]
MTEASPYRRVGEAIRGGIVCVADHSSNHVPRDIELGIDPALLEKHIALDIGVEGVAERMARRHDIPAHIACISRLVCDLHREEDSPGVVPQKSDGHLIPGNIGANIERRLERFHRPYHVALGEWLDEAQPELIVALHSFTPQMESGGEERPWEVALLYNHDDRAARHAIRLFAEEGLIVGDNQPYSGKQLNATMDRHAEALGRPYLTIEVRQDMIEREADQARWAALVADVARRTVLALKGT